MKQILNLSAALIVAAILAPAAQAQSVLYSHVTLNSDYRYQGTSSSEGHAVVQGVVHHFRPDGWYIGLFASQVDYGYAQGPDYELDFYGGKTLKLDRKTDIKLQALVTIFPNNKTPGPTFDFIQGGASVISKSVTLRALAGHQTTEHRPDRSYWSFGGEVRWRHLIFDLRYQDTDLSKARCGFNPDICGPAVTGSVTAVLPLVLF